MLKMCSRVLAIIFAVTMVWAGSAMALSISFNNGADNVTELTIEDGGTYDMSLEGDGSVAYFGHLDQWSISAIGTSAPVWGTTSKPMLDLFSLTITSSVGGKIAITVEDTYDNLGDLDSAIKGFEAAIGGSTTGYVDFYANINGSLIDISWNDMLHTGSAFSGAESLLMADISGDANASFTMSMTALIIQGTSGLTSFDAQIAPVPEPATMILFGIGLIGIAGVTRKKLNLKRPE